MLAGADVSGDVNLAGAVLETGDGKPALNAERSRIGSTLVLTNVKALGEVNLRSIRVGERLLLGGLNCGIRSAWRAACPAPR
jgi:hypothetical protein